MTVLILLSNTHHNVNIIIPLTNHQNIPITIEVNIGYWVGYTAKL